MGSSMSHASQTALLSSGSAESTGATIVNSPSRTSLSSERLCKICADSEPNERLFEPCRCTGSIHHSCLSKWLAMSGRKHCEICTFKYKTTRATVPNLFKWKRLTMNDDESATFTALVICSIWFASTLWYCITQRVRMEKFPELGGPLYMIVRCMYLVVDGIVLLNWYSDRRTIGAYIDKWKLLNSQLRILPFKKMPVLRKISTTGTSIISIHLSPSARVIPETSNGDTADEASHTDNTDL